MELRAEEISQIIKDQIENYEKKVEVSETGTILTVGDSVKILESVKAMKLNEPDGLSKCR